MPWAEVTEFCKFCSMMFFCHQYIRNLLPGLDVQSKSAEDFSRKELTIRKPNNHGKFYIESKLLDLGALLQKLLVT